ncbi:MAG: hypothetical protein JWN51_274 [Phycisphaerales bacterium]|nr:hypothetical protein [Phycisphaerales bacterium]
MQISVGCADCGSRYDVDEKFVGRKVKCKHCGNTFTITADSQGGDPPDPFANLTLAPTPEPEVAPSPVERPKGPAFGYSSPAAEGRRPRGSVGRAGRDTGSVGVDSATPYVLFLYVAASVVSGIYATVKLYSNLDQHAAGALVGHVWSWVIVWNILFFAIVGPLAWLGVWITSRIFNFDMVDSPYLRACGVAALPVVLFFMTQMLPANPVLIGTMLLAILPITFYMLMHVFDLDWAGSAVAFVLGGMLWAGGFVLSIVILSAVVAGGLMGAAQQQSVAAGAEPDNSDSYVPRSDSYVPKRTPSSPTVRPTPLSLADVEAASVSTLHEQLTRLAAKDMSRSTREEMTAAVGGIRPRVEALRATHANDSAWQEVADALTQLEKKIAALPSEKFDAASYFAEASAGEDWSAAPDSSAQLADEVSYKEFRFRPPVEMRMDLRSVESGPDGLIWLAQKGFQTRLSLSTLPRKDPQQRRPVTPDRPGLKRAAEARRLFFIDAEGSTVTTGKINGLAFTRIASDTGGQGGGPRSIKYVAASGDQWLIVSVAAPQDEPLLAQTLDISARSLRKAQAGEERADPFSPKLVAPRLADDPEHALPILRAKGAAAEEALLPLLASDDRFLRQRVVPLLAKIATVKSIPALEAAAKSNDKELAAMAHAALRRVDPDHHDEVTDLLDALAGTDYFSRRDALEKLAALAPDDKHRSAVVAHFIVAAKGRDRTFNSETIGKALAAWGDAKLVPELIPMLDRAGDRNQRQIAMTALAALKDKRGAGAVVMWLMEEPQQTIASLTEMGPVAEDAVMPHLRNPDPRVRTSAAQILEHVGTRKCLSELDRAAHDMRGRDGSARQVAQFAIEAVKARIAAQPKPDEGNAPRPK